MTAQSGQTRMAWGDSSNTRESAARPVSRDSPLRLGVLWRRLSQITIVRFGMVGGTGYLIYQAVLFLVYDAPLIRFLPAKGTSATILFFEHGDVRLLITTLVATALALVAVFTGHNLWTFRDRDRVDKPVWLRFVQYVAAALVAALGIVTVTVNVLIVQFDVYHFIALPIAVSLAGIWDWLWYSQSIWRRARHRAQL